MHERGKEFYMCVSMFSRTHVYVHVNICVRACVCVCARACACV